MEILSTHNVRLINVVSTQEFYGFRLDDVDKLTKLNAILESIYGTNNAQQRGYWPTEPGCQRVYMTSEGYWRRAVVEIRTSPCTALVRQLDYGFSEEVNLNDLRPYASVKCNKYPPLAHRFSMCDETVKAVSNEDFKKLYSQDPSMLDFKDAILNIQEVVKTADDDEVPFSRTYVVLLLGHWEIKTTKSKKKKVPKKEKPKANAAASAASVFILPPPLLKPRVRPVSSSGRQPVEYKISKQLPAPILARQRSLDNLTADRIEIISSESANAESRRPILKKTTSDKKRSSEATAVDDGGENGSKYPRESSINSLVDATAFM